MSHKVFTDGSTITGRGTINSPLVSSGGGTTETASNGLTKFTNDIRLGGTLTGYTAITGNANLLDITSSGLYTVRFGNIGSGTPISVNNTIGTGTGISISTTSNLAAYFSSSNSSGKAISSSSIGGVTISATRENISNNDVVDVLQLTRNTSGVASDGIGASISFTIENSSGFNESNILKSLWTTVDSATRTSQFIIAGVNNIVTADLFTLSGSGATKLNKYGIGTFTGTPTYSLQVDSSGNIIEGTISGGATLINVTYSQLATHITNSTLVAGSTYRITDYQTIHTIPETATTYTGSTEVLQVTAIDNNSLHPIAKSETHASDIIYYNPSNDVSIVPGCTKGYIYRRIDPTISVDICYDWREVTFRRWQSDIPIYSAGTTYARGTFVRSNVDNTYLYVSLENSNTGNALATTSFWNYWGVTSASFHNKYIGLSSGNPFSLTANTTDYKTFSGTTTYFNVRIERTNSTSTILYNNVFFDCTVRDFYITTGTSFLNNTFTNYGIRDFTVSNNSTFSNNYSINGGFFETTIDNSCLITSNVINSGLTNNKFDIACSISSNLFNYSYNIDSSILMRTTITSNIGCLLDSCLLSDSSITSNNDILIQNSNFNSSTITASKNIATIRDNTFYGLLLSGLTNSITYLKGDYHCEVYRRQDGTNKLSYINNSDVLTIVDPTT